MQKPEQKKILIIKSIPKRDSNQCFETGSRLDPDSIDAVIQADQHGPEKKKNIPKFHVW